MWPDIITEKHVCSRCGFIRHIIKPPGCDRRRRWHGCTSGVVDSIVEALDIIKSEIPPNPFGNLGPLDEFTWWDWDDDDGGRLLPSLRSFSSPFLYRGQNARYDPCTSKLYRGYPIVRRGQKQYPTAEQSGYQTIQHYTNEQKCYVILWHIRMKEFGLLLESHPASHYARVFGIHLARDALAQHYGLLTDRLDLTQDPEVAAFFATCRPDAEDIWHPVTEGIGVIYCFAFAALMSTDVERGAYFLRNVCEPIGLQTFPRPGEQKAWTLRLPPGMDFHDMPCNPVYFRQTLKGSLSILNRWDKGRSLFPQDELADAAVAIGNDRTLSEEVVHAALLEEGCRPHLINEAIAVYGERFNQMFNVRITSRSPASLGPEATRRMLSTWEVKNKTFLEKVVTMGVRVSDPSSLIDLLKSKRQWNRALSAKLLGELGKEAICALPALRLALQDIDCDVREAAATAISRIESEM